MGLWQVGEALVAWMDSGHVMVIALAAAIGAVLMVATTFLGCVIAAAFWPPVLAVVSRPVDCWVGTGVTGRLVFFNRLSEMTFLFLAFWVGVDGLRVVAGAVFHRCLLT